MPSKYVVRNLKGNTYYHIYNHGVNMVNIFLEDADYEKFLYYLYIYTASPDKVKAKYPDLPRRLKSRNLYGEVFVVAYCLMPNHFHILLKQQSDSDMPRLLKQVVNAYITYFNSKYKKTGPVFAGRYKSIRIESEYLLSQMVRFVHLNPSIHKLTAEFHTYHWTSFFTHEIAPGLINRFDTKAQWESFHRDRLDYERTLEKLTGLMIDM